MTKSVKKKAAKKKRQPPIDPNLSAVAMIERSLRAHEMPSPERIEAQIAAYMRIIGKKGGEVSGARRMKNLTTEQRQEIALKAARARWAKAKQAR